MTLPAALTPLTSPATLRRAVLLVVGGVVAAAYGLLWVGFAQMYADPAISRAVTNALVVVTAAIVLLPPFLHPVRVLEAAAARALLDVDLPQPGPSNDPGATMRGAAWFVAHLVAGTVAVLSLLLTVPFAVTLVAWHLGATALRDTLGPLADLPAALAAGLAVVLLLLPPYAMWALAAILRSLAPALLGPSARERIAALEAEKRELAARNALARDLHDSVGHALTVTTLQAAAAERALDSQPEFARSALAAIADTGREAVAELDRVLGVLRTGEPAAPEAHRHHRTLVDVPALVEDARVAGADVTATLPSGLDTVPAAVSREAYGILREAVTNALRHGDGCVEVTVGLDDGHLDLRIGNGLRSVVASGRARGLAGMRDRAAVLGGELTWGALDGAWLVHARLPLEVR
ncbi:MAG TPA: histidine kinase [Actinomycetales bacterium]|nr:histidine kinase [Actinomycetales bacterium]